MLVLIVDDDQEDVEIFCEAIRQIDKSIRCIQLGDGEEALSFLTTELVVLPDFIFLDINMPKMNGKQCLTSIKANPVLKDIPIVMFSTTSDADEIESCHALGADRFITKASDFKKLLGSLKRVFA